MSQTNTNTGDGNTNQYCDAGRGGQSWGGSCDQCCGDHNGNCRNNSITNCSFERKLKNGCLSKLTITKSGYQATQLKKIINALPGFCKDKNYKYSGYIISTNTELKKAHFLPVYSVRTERSPTHHVNLGSIEPTIGLDVPFIVSPTCTKMVEKSSIFNPNLVKQVISDYNQELKLKLQ